MSIHLIQADARRLPLADETVQCCVTSPPYFGLRDYGVGGQIGLEQTPGDYVSELVGVFREVRRVLKPDGVLWVNIGDSYAGSNMTGGNNGINSQEGADGYKMRRQFKRAVTLSDGLKPKDLIGIPWMLAFALRDDGWYLRSDVIWQKPNAMCESVTDRPTKSHEYIFLLSKSDRYVYDAEAIAEKSSESSGWARERAKGINTWKYNDTPERLAQTGQRTEASTLGTHGKRNKRSVWTIATTPYSGAHFATFPPALIEPCIRAGSRLGDTVLDPFSGSGTTGAVCQKWGRRYVGIELNAEYIALAKDRFRQGILWGAA